MSQTHVPPTTSSGDGGTRLEELSRPPEGPEPGPPAKAAPGRSGWTAGHIATLVAGALLVLLSLVLLGAGGTALWADRTEREAGYATTDVHEFSTSGSALATVSTELGSGGFGWLYSPSLLGEVRIRVTPTGPGGPLFVGIGPSLDVDRYLADVEHTVITEFWGEETETVAGDAQPSLPRSQDFWVASTSGSGPQTLEWDPEDGSWSVVVMNADGEAGIDVGADLGARVPALPWIALGFLVAGAVFLAGGALMIVGVLRPHRST